MRDALLAQLDLKDRLETTGGALESDEARTGGSCSSSSTSHFRVEDGGSIAYHGPTSIFRSFPSPSLQKPLKSWFSHTLPLSARDLHTRRVAADFGIDLQGEDIPQALRQFFKWQYPQFMFIYREAFLRDHFSDNYHNRQYWSSPLLFAMCAIGLVTSPDHDKKAMCDRFFSAAETILLVSEMCNPCITTVQAFLCLALYDIGRGRLSSGWRFSGIAFRMAQDLGIPTDPRHQIAPDSSHISQEDIEIRRRIYWGCYISDKVISLMLGRPALLSDANARVEVSEPLPDISGMEDWLPAGNERPEGGQDNTRPLLPSFQVQTSLARIMQGVLDELCSEKKLLYPLRRKSQVDSLNLELYRWEADLVDSLHWNRWQTTKSSMCLSTAVNHMLFHSLRILLSFEASSSAPLMEDTSGADGVARSSADTIIAIVRKYRSQYSLKHAPFTFVYAIAQALSVVASNGIPDEQTYLLQALEECSETWALAACVKTHVMSQLRHAMDPIIQES
ncbi:hypothetical protein E8E14_012201 [Neopestalotiopsis sp. 37M]|nr:hypothetical protein E8E14_012201 [Neopestalotiopsis sp. 37M]